MQTEREAKNVTDCSVSSQVVVASANKWPQPYERQKTEEDSSSAAISKGYMEEVTFEITMPLYLRVPSSTLLACTSP